jgi:N-acetylneuraminic acid mutarotase
MPNKSLFVVCLVLLSFILMPVRVLAEGKNAIAVLDLEIKEDVPVKLKDPATNKLREVLFGSGKFKILDRNNMEKILKQQGINLATCTTGECAATAGQLLPVEKIVTGNISTLETSYLINASIIDVGTGEIEGVANLQCRQSESDLLNSISEAAKILSRVSVEQEIAGREQEIKGQGMVIEGKWFNVAATGAPSGRENHTAVWTGKEMVIWGGSAGNSYLNDGASYSPSTDTWKPVSSANAPSGRERHTAVWTGKEMIVWGGYHKTGISHYSNSGGRYDPATYSWKKIEGSELIGSAPKRRCGHTAIWTGKAMIIWGGVYWSKSHIGYVYLNDGWAYEPVKDKWKEINEFKNLEGRIQHTAVWTGNEMIIWGGYNIKDKYLNSGGRYNPKENSWVLARVGPDSRAKHTAIWTGKEMVVWGGNGEKSGVKVLNSGFRYNPVEDAWKAANLQGAPAGRELHSSVWSGKNMIIWGGWDGSAFLDRGGVYDPSADSWLALPVMNAPCGRVRHTAVWTGDEMIVWGGMFLNGGGKFRP